MTHPEAPVTIGERIKRRRELNRMSIRQAALAAGISHSQWSRIERGERTADNRFMLAAIAEVLRCSSTELTGQKLGPTDREDAARGAAVYGAIRAMLDADLDFPALAPPAPIAQLEQRMGIIYGLRSSCDYVGAARVIAEIAPRLHAAALSGRTEDRRAALRLMVLMADAAAFTARYSGEQPACALIAERGRQAAEHLGDPVLIGLAEYTRAHAALACGLYPRGQIIAERAAQLVRNAIGHPGGPEVYGQLLLTEAFARFGQGDRGNAMGLILEAAEIADRTGDNAVLNLHFGPTNVKFWRVSMHADGGDPGDAVAIASRTVPQNVVAVSRQAAFYLDTGRALAHLGRDSEALRMIATAERLAPQRVRGDRLAQETVRGLLERSRRDAAGSELLGLCERMGIAS